MIKPKNYTSRHISKHNGDQRAFVFIGQQETQQPITNAVTGSSITETIFDRMQRLHQHISQDAMPCRLSVVFKVLCNIFF